MYGFDFRTKRQENVVYIHENESLSFLNKRSSRKTGLTAWNTILFMTNDYLEEHVVARVELV